MGRFVVGHSLILGLVLLPVGCATRPAPPQRFVRMGSVTSAFDGPTLSLVDTPEIPLGEVAPDPMIAPAAIPAAAELSLHYERSCARMVDGTVRCWGLQYDDRVEPKPTTLPGLVDVAQLAVGSTHACARLHNGRVRCWGANDEGQLGDGTHDLAATPREVLGLESVVRGGRSASASAVRAASMARSRVGATTSSARWPTARVRPMCTL